MTATIENAIITYARIGIEHGNLTYMIGCEGEHGHRGFGGWGLYCEDNPLQDQTAAGRHLYQIMKMMGVEDWSRLKDMAVRIKIQGGLIIAIGHIVKNEWFEPLP